METMYQGVSGIVYEIEEKYIAKGGEGSIHHLKNDSRVVAKIFKADRRNTAREEKLRLMVRARLAGDQLQQVTWPLDVLYDQSGFAGYIMLSLKDSSPINSIYSNGFDNKYDLRFRFLAALNLCYAMQTVHEMGQVCGDLNPQNICINLNMNSENAFHITLVDTDSYHIIAGGKVFRCEVGLGEYIAPELQKKMSGGLNLRNAPLPTYTKETDLFALAVHIFTLLMNGCHPFACAMDQDGEDVTMSQMTESYTRDSVAVPQPVENIKEGFFPFYEKRAGITHPIYAPSFETLPEQLQELFVRTFVNGYEDPKQRADTQEWINALFDVKDSIVPCDATGDNDKVGKHYFFGHSPVCSLCEVEERIKGKLLPPRPPKPESSNDGYLSFDSSPPPSHQYRWVKIWGVLQVVAVFIFEGMLGSDVLSLVDDNYVAWFYMITFWLSVLSSYPLTASIDKRKFHTFMMVLWGMESAGLLLFGLGDYIPLIGYRAVTPFMLLISIINIIAHGCMLKKEP